LSRAKVVILGYRFRSFNDTGASSAGSGAPELGGVRPSGASRIAIVILAEMMAQIKAGNRAVIPS